MVEGRDDDGVAVVGKRDESADDTALGGPVGAIVEGDEDGAIVEGDKDGAIVEGDEDGAIVEGDEVGLEEHVG